MPAGRPSKLTQKARDKIVDYLADCIENNKVPTTARLAVNLDVSKKTLYNWADNDEELLHTLDKLQAIQESTLVEGSLSGKLNATIAKLMLANHNYSDKQEVKQENEGQIDINIRHFKD